MQTQHCIASRSAGRHSEVPVLDRMLERCDPTAVPFDPGSSLQCLRTATPFDISTIAALLAALGIKDRYCLEHSRRVSRLARELARFFELPQEQQYKACLGGLLHDLGKIFVTDSVLFKSTPLTESEWLEMQAHPATGALVLRMAKFSEDIVLVVRHHHEDFAGTGYPDSLRGEEIPFLARIIRVADAFDALTTDRPYRRGYSVTEALGLLRMGTGSSFDPAIVSAMRELISSMGFRVQVDDGCLIFRAKPGLLPSQGQTSAVQVQAQASPTKGGEKQT